MRSSFIAAALLAVVLFVACTPAADASAVQKNKKDVDFYEGGFFPWPRTRSWATEKACICVWRMVLESLEGRPCGVKFWAMSAVRVLATD